MGTSGCFSEGSGSIGRLRVTQLPRPLRSPAGGGYTPGYRHTESLQWQGRDSNPRSPDYETGEMPLLYPAIEKVTDGTRTRNLRGHIPALSPLELRSQSGWPDSNRRPPAPKAGTLPSALHPVLPGLRLHRSGPAMVEKPLVRVRASTVLRQGGNHHPILAPPHDPCNPGPDDGLTRFSARNSANTPLRSHPYGSTSPSGNLMS